MKTYIKLALLFLLPLPGFTQTLNNVSTYQQAVDFGAEKTATYLVNDYYQAIRRICRE